MQMVHSRFNALLSACVLSLIATASWSQSLTWLGVLPGGNRSEAYGVSADGAVVVGWSYNNVGSQRAFRWTASGGMQDLGTLYRSYAFGVSADGRVVVGWAEITANGTRRAFRWSSLSYLMRDLLLPGYSFSEAYGVSANGAVVVGRSYNNPSAPRAFRWTASGGIQDLGALPGVNRSEAYAVSANGAVVVGRSYNNSNQPRAFRWENGVMQDLGALPGGNWSEAYGVSANGAVVVGWSYNNAGNERAFRWTASGGMEDLGTLPGYDRSWAYAVSADGAVVVGRAINDAVEDNCAVRWTASGIEDLNTTYASLLRGSALWEARAISPDGRYIVGRGYNAATHRIEAFLLDTRGNNTLCTLDGDVNGDGIVDDADLLEVLFNFGNRCP